MKGWSLLLASLAGCGGRTDLSVPPVKATSICASDTFSCALLSDESAACWGAVPPWSGPGLGTPRPVPLEAGAGIQHLSCGGETICAVLADGSPLCWHLDADARTSGTDFTAISTTTTYACGVHANGTVSCWGSSSGADGEILPTAPLVDGLDDAVAVSVGPTLACAMRASGAVACWGAGPLGDGTMNGSTTPVTVQGLPGRATQIAVGSMRACALIEDGTVSCWGTFFNDAGVDPAALSPTAGLTPLAVAGLSGVKAVSAGTFQSCAVLDDGTVRHWGTDYWENGAPPGAFPTHWSFTPYPVPGLTSVVAVASAEMHNCALLADGHVECWGDNRYGQLGDGTMTRRSAPVRVVDLP